MRPVLVLFLFLAVAGPSEHDCDLTRNNINIEKQHWKITLLKLQTWEWSGDRVSEWQREKESERVRKKKKHYVVN